MSRLASRLRRHRRGADPAGPEPSAPALLTVVLSADGDLGAGSLASVLAQSYQAIEVLVVAPGPAGADQSRLTSNDSRVRGLSAPAGVAAGWNAGAAAATGRYLTLLEAGDLVSSDGYRTLVDHLESSGSDLAVGSYDQLRLGEPQPPPRWVAALHAAVRHRVTLNELPALLANEVLSTKVFRRSYFERAGLQVTDSPLGELDLTTSGYALASSIEVATVPVVHRRAAPGRPVTVPERRAAAERTLRLLSAHASSTVPARYAAQLLAQDPFGLDEIARDEDAHWQTLQAGVRLLTAVAEEAAVHELVPAADRVLYWLLEHDRQEAAVRFVESGGRATELWEQRVVEGRVLLQLPYSGDAGVGVPTGCFVPAQTEVELRSGVTSAAFTDDGQLRLRGFAFLTCTGPELGLPRVELVEHQLGLRVPMQVRHRPDPVARRRSGHERIDYARSGFEATLDVRRLRAAAPPDGGAFQLEIALEASGTTRTGPPDGRAGALASLPAQVIDEEVLVLPSWSEPDGLVLTVQPSTAAPAGTGPASVVLTDVALDDTDLLLQCALADPGIETVSAELTGPAHTLRTGPVAAVDGRITLRFSLSTEEETGFDPVAPSSGRYRIELRRHPDGSRPLVVAMDERLSVEGWPDLLGPLARVTLRPNRRGRPTIELGAPLPAGLLTPFGQRAQQDRYRKVREPIRDGLYLQCLRGDQVADSQLAVGLRYAARFPTSPVVWGVADRSVPVPVGHRSVLIGTPDHYDAVGQLRQLCFNHELPTWLSPRAGQVVTQTYHGHPFKAMGLSRWRAQGLSPRQIEQLLAERRSWDLLLSPSATATRLYRENFPLDAQVVEVGHPRNDRLARTGPAERDRMRERLGIDPAATVVLYAPTYRDDLGRGPWKSPIALLVSPTELARALGDGFVVLLRGHPANARHSTASRSKGRVVDATSHPDVNDLIIASDVGVFDYSSIRFDYAVTGRPMVYLVPDKQAYFQALAPLLDYDDTVAGPQVATLEELVTAVRQVLADPSPWRPAYESLQRSFTYLDDGGAADRLLDAMLAAGDARR